MGQYALIPAQCYQKTMRQIAQRALLPAPAHIVVID
jgi:hypothetical protein